MCYKDSVVYPSYLNLLVRTLDKKYGDINIKRYSKVIHLGCELDEIMSWKTMALQVTLKNQQTASRTFNR